MTELGPHPELLIAGRPAEQLDSSTAHPARMYDYYLGGRDNYLVDREAAEQVIAEFPQIRLIALANRAFLQRAVQLLVRSGVRQFLDIGCGIPASNDATETARAIDPDARVVAIDNDPLVLTHAEALLPAANPQGTAVLEADLRRPETILQHPLLRGLLDLREPVGLLLVAVVHFLPDSDRPHMIVHTLMDALAPGSYLVLSHATADSQRDAATAAAEHYRHTRAPITLRTRAQITAFFDGLDLLEPGVVAQPWWRPDSDQVAADPRANWGYGAVARKPRTGMPPR